MNQTRKVTINTYKMCYNPLTKTTSPSEICLISQPYDLLKQYAGYLGKNGLKGIFKYKEPQENGKLFTGWVFRYTQLDEVTKIIKKIEDGTLEPMASIPASISASTSTSTPSGLIGKQNINTSIMCPLVDEILTIYVGGKPYKGKVVSIKFNHQLNIVDGFNIAIGEHVHSVKLNLPTWKIENYNDEHSIVREKIESPKAEQLLNEITEELKNIMNTPNNDEDFFNENNDEIPVMDDDEN